MSEGGDRIERVAGVIGTPEISLFEQIGSHFIFQSIIRLVSRENLKNNIFNSIVLSKKYGRNRIV